ncbi:MAG: AAA family ATPase [Moraxella sp.]
MSVSLLRQHMQDTGLSQAKIATIFGVSPAVVSQYLKGIYTGDVAAIDEKVVQMLQRAKDKAGDIKSNFVPTETAKKIIDVCGMAHTMNDINLVIGEAGLGKTVALKHYADNTAGVVFVEVEPTFSPKIMLMELCQKLGINPSRNNHDNISAITEKLKGSERLIIIDEAELLSYKCLEIIRRIHDMTGVGVVLAGMPRLRRNLRGKSGEYKQLYSRIGFACDIKDKLPDSDLDLLIKTAFGTDEFTQQLRTASHGNARRLNKLLRGVNRLAKLNNKPVSQKMIETISGMLID